MKKFNPDYFLFENVKSMSNAVREAFSKELNVEPILINSSLLSAQYRQRYYWTNIPGVRQPENKEIFFDKIIEHSVDHRYYFTDASYKCLDKILQRSKERGLGFRDGVIHLPWKEKFKNLDANYHKGSDGKRSMVADREGNYRMATPTEAEKLQTFPSGYTSGVSNTQRYRQLGNSWTVDIIAHILSYLPGIKQRDVEVLSMYDGISAGRVALERVGAEVTRYYATEIDKYAIQTTMANYPDTIQLGDAFQVRDDTWTLNQNGI